MKKLCRAIGLAALLPLCGAANAALIADPLASDTYITLGSLDWAWASPVNNQDWYGLNTLMAPEFHAGWRFATEQEMASRPTLGDFTRQDGSYIQAAAYWNTYFTHVDAGDLASGYVSSSWGGYWNETLYVRDAGPSQGNVPEPATLGLLALGLMGIGAARKRQA